MKLDLLSSETTGNLDPDILLDGICGWAEPQTKTQRRRQHHSRAAPLLYDRNILNELHSFMSVDIGTILWLL